MAFYRPHSKKKSANGYQNCYRFFKKRLSELTMRPFVLELDELQNKILEMGGLVETSIHNSIRSLVERDDALMAMALGVRRAH